MNWDHIYACFKKCYRVKIVNDGCEHNTMRSWEEGTGKLGIQFCLWILKKFAFPESLKSKLKQLCMCYYNRHGDYEWNETLPFPRKPWDSSSLWSLHFTRQSFHHLKERTSC